MEERWPVSPSSSQSPGSQLAMLVLSMPECDFPYLRSWLIFSGESTTAEVQQVVVAGFAAVWVMSE